MLNVGWLDRGHDFPIADPDSDMVRRLTRLADVKVNKMRGWHSCEFCDAESPITLDLRGRPVYLGNGEIHVRSRSGTVYAAPTLVVHYITEHRYAPPAEFSGALVRLGGLRYHRRLAKEQQQALEKL